MEEKQIKYNPLKTLGKGMIIVLIVAILLYLSQPNERDIIINAFVGSFYFVFPFAVVIMIGKMLFFSKRSSKFLFFLPLISIAVFTAFTLLLFILGSLIKELSGEGVGDIILLVIGNFIYLIFGIIYSIVLYRRKKKILHEEK